MLLKQFSAVWILKCSAEMSTELCCRISPLGLNTPQTFGCEKIVWVLKTPLNTILPIGGILMKRFLKIPPNGKMVFGSLGEFKGPQLWGYYFFNETHPRPLQGKRIHSLPTLLHIVKGDKWRD